MYLRINYIHILSQYLAIIYFKLLSSLSHARQFYPFDLYFYFTLRLLSSHLFRFCKGVPLLLFIYMWHDSMPMVGRAGLSPETTALYPAIFAICRYLTFIAIG